MNSCLTREDANMTYFRPQSAAGMNGRNRNSWGPMSAPNSGFQRLAPDEDYAEEYTERMLGAQLRQLFPLQEDLAEWLNKIIGVDYISGDNFFNELDNGVVLCHLAKVIHEKAKMACDAGLVKGPPPAIRGKCFEKAMRRSFFSRDNMENFIKFCRVLGVHENLLFESDDLVLHNQPRNVVLCLLEVARLATRYGVEPPGLVQLEKEIAEEERSHSDSGLSHSSLLSWQFQASPPRMDSDKLRHNRWSTGTHMVLIPDPGPSGDSLPGITASGASDGVPSDTTEDDWSRGSGEDPDLEIETAADMVVRGGHSGGGDDLSELDRKVQQATRLMQKNCQCANDKCTKLKVKKVGEGKYNIGGRNVFIRLLKGRHMMVRVGGGWDTLDHFLLRHDPCQENEREIKPRPQPIAKTLPRPKKVEKVQNFAKKYTYYNRFSKLLRPGETRV